MMEEVSTIMAYDAQVMEQMSEEEILACLVGGDREVPPGGEQRSSGLQLSVSFFLSLSRSLSLSLSDPGHGGQYGRESS
ncbi:hypothetical protein EYF80_064960 [Liparis tanakae]|uniref:Uncharacterized protein n=1 Tax=Liparis tanakae TaxID=230148 RepID=A0A4Z2E8R3_9TELE|nr:hypothetical protein EYF80_064960 [Liparis tanakae]